MGFTEFYCDPVTGSNLNGGSDQGTPSYFTTNGNWNSTSGKFFPTSTSPSPSVTAGQFASIFLDQATSSSFVARVTQATSTFIVVSATAKSGTAPATTGSGMSINVGGAWQGSTGVMAFPFGFITNTLTDSSAEAPRVNFKNSAPYLITGPMVHSNSGPTMFQGYNATVGDGGRATIDGGTAGTSYILLTNNNAAQNEFFDFIFQNNGATGSAAGVSSGVAGNGFGSFFGRCVFNNLQGYGISLVSSGIEIILECEAYACNKSNTTVFGGFHCTSGSKIFIRCFSHDNTGSNAHGFVASGIYINCIGSTNGGQGFLFNGGQFPILLGCDAYNNTSDGFGNNAGGGNEGIYVENCSFVKNGGYGINLVAGSIINGMIVNCGFGSGSQVNTSGQTNVSTTTDMMSISGSVTYPPNLTPWTNPANGNFSINLAQAKNAGRGFFLEASTSLSNPNTVGYPDIGAATHYPTGFSAPFND